MLQVGMCLQSEGRRGSAMEYQIPGISYSILGLFRRKKWWDQLSTFIDGFSIEFACRQKQSKSNGDHATMVCFNITIRSAQIEITWRWEALKAARSQISHISPCLWTRVCKPRTILKKPPNLEVVLLKSSQLTIQRPFWASERALRPISWCGAPMEMFLAMWLGQWQKESPLLS